MDYQKAYLEEAVKGIQLEMAYVEARHTLLRAQLPEKIKELKAYDNKKDSPSK